MLNTRQNPRSDEDKALSAPEVTQEPRSTSNKCSNEKKTAQAREATPPEESKSDTGEENDDEIDYQCVVRDGTFPEVSRNVAMVFAKVPPARQRVNVNAFLKFLESTSVT